MKVCVVMQQASSGEQLAALQKELEQLHADNAHMEGQVKAAQVAQVFRLALSQSTFLVISTLHFWPLLLLSHAAVC